MDIVGLDTSHILYREFYRQVGDKPASKITDNDIEVATKKALRKIQGYKRRFGADKFVAAFDDRSSWREWYSREHGMRSYKHNRRLDVRQKRIQKVFNSFRMDVKKQLKGKKGIEVVFGKGLESDDLLSGLAYNKKKKDILRVLTLDRDLRQLMLVDGVSVLDINNGKEMNRNNIRRDLFDRIVRGRHSYNVVSVFNRLSEEKADDAFRNPMALEELFDEEPPNNDTALTARQRYNGNSRLLDMSKQPKEVKAQVKKVLSKALTNNDK